jgi:hypothetical protein
MECLLVPTKKVCFSLKKAIAFLLKCDRFFIRYNGLVCLQGNNMKVVPVVKVHWFFYGFVDFYLILKYWWDVIMSPFDPDSVVPYGFFDSLTLPYHELWWDVDPEEAWSAED